MSSFTLSKVDGAIAEMDKHVLNRDKISGVEFAESCLRIAKSLRNGLEEALKEIDRLKDHSGPGSTGRSGVY